MAIADFFPDTAEFPENFFGLVQLIYIAATYLFVLMTASRMISEGSELLLLVPKVAGIVGSIILPILSSVPDGALVLFSGMGDDAQEKLGVGVGSLAGSTIMLLTVPWFIAVFIGRVDVDPVSGNAIYAKPKLSGRYTVMKTGVTISSTVKERAYVLLITAIPYLILQIPGMFYAHSSVERVARGESMFALIGLIVCSLFFVGYLYNEYRKSDEEGNVVNEIKLEYMRDAINNQRITLIGVMAGLLQTHRKRSKSEHDLHRRTSMKDLGERTNNRVISDLKSLLYPFFTMYDIDHSKYLDVDELMFVFNDLGEKNMDRQDIIDLFSGMDMVRGIDYETFVHGIYRYIVGHEHLLDHVENHHAHLHSHHQKPTDGTGNGAGNGAGNGTGNGAGNGVEMAGLPGGPPGGGAKMSKREIRKAQSTRTGLGLSTKLQGGNGLGNYQSVSTTGSGSDANMSAAAQGTELDELEEDEEVEEIPADLSDLTPEQQQTIIIRRAIVSMTIGAVIILLFSDPMVDVLVDLGTRTGVPAFYVSFIFAPLAGNIPEVLAAFTYSARKTTKSTRIALATLQGSTILNNTFVLALFMFLVYARSLAWEFFAETLTILVVEICVFCFSLKKTQTVLDATLILALYPLSLVAIIVLTMMGWD